VDALRRNSREIVEGDRFSRRAISRTPSFCARQMAMSSRSAKDRYRPDTVGAREGFTPPACRNHRTPTADDTPISSAASSELAPCPIAAQNWTRSCRQATVGRPGDGICPRYSCTARCRSRIVAINTSIDKVLPRPAESTQYTSLTFGRRLRAAGLIASMGTVGDALDNAVAESFFATLECELLDRYDWPTRQALRTAVFDFIEVFYNRQRRHSTLDYLTPVDYEHQHPSPAPAA